ncbi:MAG: hypothetical protein FJ298_03140 [Planctomycetes bacterium]|nr:hypothetical protein [Planctomycetota bacterium]
MAAPALSLQIAGWIGNASFFSRFFVQWYTSEREGKSVAPPLFWWLSLVGTVLLGVYSYSRASYVLVLGYAINGLIYARNLRLHRPGATALGVGQLAALGACAAAALVGAAAFEVHRREEADVAWVAVALVAQSAWSSRFVVQWWASERASESHFPRAFWWLSLLGNALLLAYTIHLQDAVLAWGYVPGPIVQVRNLMLGRRSSKTE